MSLLFGLPHLLSFGSTLSIFHNTPNPSEFSSSYLKLHKGTVRNDSINISPIADLTSPLTFVSSSHRALDDLNPLDIFFLSSCRYQDCFSLSHFASICKQHNSPSLPNYRATLSFHKSLFTSSFQSELFIAPFKSSCLSFVPALPSISSLSVLLLCCGGVPGTTGHCLIFHIKNGQKELICSSPVKLFHSSLVHLPDTVIGSEISIHSTSNAIIPIIIAQSSHGQLIVEHTHPLGSFFPPGHRTYAAKIKKRWL